MQENPKLIRPMMTFTVLRTALYFIQMRLRTSEAVIGGFVGGLLGLYFSVILYSLYVQFKEEREEGGLRESFALNKN